MAMKLDHKIKDKNILAAYFGLIERKYQSIFDKKKME